MSTYEPSRCQSIYPPSADAPHEGPGWSAPFRCVLSDGHEGDRHWNSGINWVIRSDNPEASS